MHNDCKENENVINRLGCAKCIMPLGMHDSAITEIGMVPVDIESKHRIGTSFDMESNLHAKRGFLRHFPHTIRITVPRIFHNIKMLYPNRKFRWQSFISSMEKNEYVIYDPREHWLIVVNTKGDISIQKEFKSHCAHFNSEETFARWVSFIPPIRK